MNLIDKELDHHSYKYFIDKDYLYEIKDGYNLMIAKYKGKEQEVMIMYKIIKIALINVLLIF